MTIIITTYCSVSSCVCPGARLIELALWIFTKTEQKRPSALLIRAPEVKQCAPHVTAQEAVKLDLNPRLSDSWVQSTQRWSSVPHVSQLRSRKLGFEPEAIWFLSPNPYWLHFLGPPWPEILISQVVVPSSAALPLRRSLLEMLKPVGPAEHRLYSYQVIWGLLFQEQTDWHPNFWNPSNLSSPCIYIWFSKIHPRNLLIFKNKYGAGQLRTKSRISPLLLHSIPTQAVLCRA